MTDVSTMMTGTIKRLVADRGFGFINAEDGKEYFFHRSSIENGRWSELQEGDRVTFIGHPDSERGPRAARVVPERP